MFRYCVLLIDDRIFIVGFDETRIYQAVNGKSQNVIADGYGEIVLFWNRLDVSVSINVLVVFQKLLWSWRNLVYHQF